MRSIAKAPIIIITSKNISTGSNHEYIPASSTADGQGSLTVVKLIPLLMGVVAMWWGGVGGANNVWP